MSHFIYRTEAIILGEMPSGEDNKIYFLLTEDLGFIMAQATGVRHLKSKLRFHLSLFSKIGVELVRGKNIWRIINVYPREKEIFFKTKYVNIFARLAQLIRRMVHGEVQNKKLFDDVLQTRMFLAENILSNKEETSVELISVARILNSLGYFIAEGKYQSILYGHIEKGILRRALLLRNDLVNDINLALKESHL